jgi:hypothetical protein
MFPIPSALWMKLVAIGAVCALLYFLGWNHEHKKFVEFKAEVSALGKAQEEKNAAIVLQHEQITQGIKDEYEAKLAAVNNYYAIGVQSNPSSGRLPAAPSTTSGATAIPEYRLLAQRCAATTLELEELQKWVKANAK